MRPSIWSHKKKFDKILNFIKLYHILLYFYYIYIIKFLKFNNLLNFYMYFANKAT